MLVEAGLSLEDVDRSASACPAYRASHRQNPLQPANAKSTSILPAIILAFRNSHDHRERCPFRNTWPPLFGKARDLEYMVLISLEQTLGLGVLHRTISSAAQVALATISATSWLVAKPGRHGSAGKPGMRKCDPCITTADGVLPRLSGLGGATTCAGAGPCAG